jgi:hypothetical protein
MLFYKWKFFLRLSLVKQSDCVARRIVDVRTVMPDGLTLLAGAGGWLVANQGKSRRKMEKCIVELFFYAVIMNGSD